MSNIIDYLTYCNYRHNRALGMAKEDLEECYGKKMDEYEEQYLNSLIIKADDEGQPN